jgi:hypothetical protein
MRLQLRLGTPQKSDDGEYQEHYKQYFGDARCPGRNASESEDCGDKRYNEKDNRVIKHGPSFEFLLNYTASNMTVAHWSNCRHQREPHSGVGRVRHGSRTTAAV